MEVPTQKRTPSRCREWERARRNKFNDAIVKLGEVAKAINKTNFPDADVDDVQCPKVEIIQKAIVCLTNCSQQITQLKAEILAVQVQLETAKPKENCMTDASTQVYFGLSKKRKDGKYVKLLMLKKAKVNKCNKNVINNNNNNKPQTEASRKLPKLLPRGIPIDKKGPENTFVVLPAAPYIFPPRPLLFPTVPPAIVLVDQNLQPLNKGSVPLVSRNNGDVTKTTMVNILPISAYSHPLSAVKNKKQNVKYKNDIGRKVNKKSKSVENTQSKETSKINEVKKKPAVAAIISKESKILEESSKENNKNVNMLSKTDNIAESDKSANKEPPQSSDKEDKIQNEQAISIHKGNNVVTDIDNHKNKEIEVPNITCKPKSPEAVTKELPITTPKSIDDIKCTNINKIMKTSTNKENVSEIKEKENKIPNILPLDTSMCDNVVDAGNARLELAEEFLATSPTAAFLMSFPLVSGNRADSPAEEQGHSTTQANPKENQRRTELAPPAVAYFEKSNNDIKVKSASKISDPCNTPSKQNEQQKCVNSTVTKESNNTVTVTKPSNPVPLPNISSENPFLNLSMPSLISTNCTLPDTNFGIDFDCNISKTIPSQPTSYVSSNNFFYKSDPFGTVKNTIYSTSSITSSHDFNSLGLYPCAMEKYASKNKADYSSVDDNLMKIGSSRLTYDIDLGWSQKGLDFVNCTTTANTFNKDTILTSTTSAPYSTSYNPFTPDFHVPLVPTTNKKDNTNKAPSSSFADSITSYYSQPTNLWPDDVPFYTNANISKPLNSKNQNYPVVQNVHNNLIMKSNVNKHYETKMAEANIGTGIKDNSNVGGQPIIEKYTKKSPSKMHINWMTSEIRSVQNNFNLVNPSNTELKETNKSSYSHIDHTIKKQDNSDSNYFPISMHNFSAQPAQDDFQMWPSSTRPLGTTEISIDPPPINLPTLVGDLALGPHEKNKKMDVTNRAAPQSDIQHCGNFLSVTQLMNRSTDNMHSRFPVPNIEASKSIPAKQHINHFANDSHRNQMSQPCYVFNDPKLVNSYDNMAQFTHPKTKSNSKTEKSSKTQKNNYSTEALLRGANCTQKIQDSNSAKFMVPPQKYADYNTTQDTAVAQVSHFPPILDYSDNGYTSQQFSGTTLYNTTTNTISNSFYSNFMPGSSNLMSSNYTSGPFTGDFIDYNQTAECNYANQKYEELKMRNNTAMFQSEKVPPTNYKSSRRESTKHKLECSKKDSNKKYQSKKAKINNDIEDWNDPSHLLWQNKSSNKKHTNLMSEEIPFPNYMANQMPTQYQSDFFNSHLVPTNVQNMGHNVDRSLAGFPATSRANFNLSTIFPEITMKVQ